MIIARMRALQPFVCWCGTVAGQSRPWRSSEQAIGWRIDFGSDENSTIVLQRKGTVGSQYARISAVPLASRRISTWISVLLSFTTSALGWLCALEQRL